MMATERAVAEWVRYQLRGSYSHHRRMLARCWRPWSFRCYNSAYRPVMDALDLLARYADGDTDERFYAAGDLVPVDGVVPKAWREGVVDAGSGRIERIPYELCADRGRRCGAARSMFRGRPVEGPGRGPARRFRGQPGRPLCRTGHAAGRHRVRRRSEGADAGRAGPARHWPGQRHHWRGADRHQGGQPVGERAEAGQASRA